MDIDRHKSQPCDAIDRVSFCLDKLEKAYCFVNGVEWITDVVPRCTIEEIVGALVAAEQELKTS